MENFPLDPEPDVEPMPLTPVPTASAIRARALSL
jgi:hypothetical protein